MPEVGRDTQESVFEGRLDDRVIDVLLEHPGTVAFNGLRRALQAHPEALARALRRLERDGLVRREPEGYSAITAASVERADHAERPRSLVASVGLPPGITADTVLGTLAGRWFGSLRWLGVHEYPGEPTLVWSAADAQGHVLLSVRRGHLRVRVDARPGSGNFIELERAAYELLQYALTRIHRLPELPAPTSGVVELSRIEPGSWKGTFAG